MATSANQSQQLRPVVLKDFDDPPIVLGKKKKLLKRSAYLVIKAMLDHAAKHPDVPMTKDVLEAEGRGSARRILKELRDSDSDWAEVIAFPLKGHAAGYRIAAAQTRRG